MSPVYALVVVTMSMVMIIGRLTLAKEIIVGGDKGWTTKFNYEAWAAGHDFHVGDTLVFKYKTGAHNVFRVDGSTYAQCVPPPVAEALTSGNDRITLDAPGRKWFICGIGRHCEDGNTKLDITVFPQLQSPSPSSWPPPETGFSGSLMKTILQLSCEVLVCVVISFLLI